MLSCGRCHAAVGFPDRDRDLTVGALDALARRRTWRWSPTCCRAEAGAWQADTVPEAFRLDVRFRLPSPCGRGAWAAPGPRGVASPRPPAPDAPVDVVHGTNFVVPPSKRAARVATVHDLTAVRFPDLCTATTALSRSGPPGGSPRGLSTRPRSSSPRRCESGWPRPRTGPGRLHGVGLPGVPGTHARGPSRRRRRALRPGLGDRRAGTWSSWSGRGEEVAPRSCLHLVIAGPDGWGPEALAGRGTFPFRPRIVRVGWVSGEQRSDVSLAGAAVFAFPFDLRGFRCPAGGPLTQACRWWPAGGAVPEVVGDGAEVVAVGDQPASCRCPVVRAGGPRRCCFTRCTRPVGELLLGHMRPRSGAAVRGGRHRGRPAMPAAMADGSGPGRVAVVAELCGGVPGGIGTYVRGLARGLREVGADQEVFVVASRSWRATRCCRGLGLGRARHPLAVVVAGSALGARSSWRARGPKGGPCHASSLLVPWRGPAPRTVMVHDLAWRVVPEAFPGERP